MKKANEKCTASTVMLNCGCCESVFLNCDLEYGHDGSHLEVRTEMGAKGSKHIIQTIRVIWEITAEETVK